MDKTGRTGRRAFGGIGRMAGFAAGAIGTAGLVGAASAAFGEMSEAQKVSRPDTGGVSSQPAAPPTSPRNTSTTSPSRLLKKSGVDDEVIKSGENMLLTFTNIRNEAGKGNKIFDQATKATLLRPVSVATGAGHDQGGDPSSAKH